MNTERDPQPNSPLTLEAVTARAKETLLADGAHMPMLIVNGKRQTLIVGFDEMPGTHSDRLKLLFLAGVAVGKEDEAGPLQRVFFISERWMSESAGELPDVPPSQESEP